MMIKTNIKAKLLNGISQFSLPRKNKKNVLILLMILFSIFSLWNNYHLLEKPMRRILEPFENGDIGDDEDNQDDATKSTSENDNQAAVSSMNTNPYNFNDFTYKSVLKIITNMHKELKRLMGEMDKLEVDPVTTYELSEEKVNMNEGNLEQYKVLKNKFLQKLKERNEYVHGRYETFMLNLNECDDKQRFIRFLMDLDMRFASDNQSIRRKVNRIIQIEKQGLDDVVMKLSEGLHIEQFYLIGTIKTMVANEYKNILNTIKFYNSKNKMSISGKDMVLTEDCN